MSDPSAVPGLGVAPCAHGRPPATGAIRREPEDFVVDEILGFEPEGTGNHGLLVVEKRGANTGWVAAQLARHAGVAVRDVGFSGHKDRHALTTQAYSLPLPVLFDVARCLEWQGEGYAVRAAHRHGRKLRPGSHRANRFELRIRDLRGDRGAIEASPRGDPRARRAELLRPATVRARRQQSATGAGVGRR